jgi:alkanesulfonate monooxygenase SsuD/methylene tetrahydromethanopterin reductase-like flavin-dependent oxidoreductase (luciferase family)
MDFGIFMEFETRRGASQAVAFEEGFGLVDAAEAWGLDVAWLGEMHFSPARSVLSAPIAIACAIASRTRRLRVGTAVQVLPLNNPLRIAEEAATTDHIAGGRFDFGIGRSGFPRVYDTYGIPYAESQGRFHEALEIILEAWKGEPFSYHGEFYHFDNVSVSPRPYQLPHPPLRMAATTEETFPRVGEMGLPIFVGLRGMDVTDLATHLRAYRQAWREAGHPGDGDVCLRIPVYAGPTEQAALEEPRESITFYFGRQADLTKAGVGREGAGPADRLQARVDRLATLSYDQILRERVAFGTAAGLVDRLTELREMLHLNAIAAELNSGGLLSHEQSKRTLRIMTHEVMPAFK